MRENDYDFLLKLDAIRDVQSEADGKRSRINGIYTIATPFKELCDIINQDERRVTYGHDVDFRIRHLLQHGIWNIIKNMPGDEGVQFIKLLMDAENEVDAMSIRGE